MTAIVYTASANMPQSCMGRYRKVYVIDVDPQLAADPDWRPTSVRNKEVRKVLHDYGPQSVGKTERCAYQRTIAAATELARQYNRNVPGKPERAPGIHERMGGVQMTDAEFKRAQEDNDPTPNTTL